MRWLLKKPPWLHMLGTKTNSIEKKKVMAMNHFRSVRIILSTKDAVKVACQQTFATWKAKKGGKRGAAADRPKASSLSKEVKASIVVGGNIRKEGTDPKFLPDSEYPDWLCHLIDEHYVKFDNRTRIKENISLKAKN